MHNGQLQGPYDLGKRRDTKRHFHRFLSLTMSVYHCRWAPLPRMKCATFIWCIGLMARRSWKTKGVNSKTFSLFVLFKSLPFRCVSVGPPVYSWGRIWPIGGNFSISYFKSSIQISINEYLSFDRILFLRGTRYGPMGVREAVIYVLADFAR